jgi:hypothetical protein
MLSRSRKSFGKRVRENLGLQISHSKIMVKEYVT